MVADETQQMIPVYCTAPVPNKTIDEFLERAYSSSFNYHRFCLITTKDVGSLKEPSHTPVANFVSPFLDRFSGVCGGYVSKYTSSNSRLSDKAFIYLDDQTVKDGNTCCIADADKACVRATFDYSNVVINHLIHETRGWLQLQNEAAIAGGVLQASDTNENQPMTEDGKTLADELQRQDPRSWSLRGSSGNEKLTPVFCTADIPVEILEDFLSSTYKELRSLVKEDAARPGYIRLVTNTDPFSQSSPTKSLPIGHSATSAFTSFLPETLSTFTKIRCGGESPLGNLSFLILDQHTASGSKTCIVALNDDELEPGVHLVRCEYNIALSVAYALADGVGPAFKEYADLAAMQHDGVYRS